MKVMELKALAKGQGLRRYSKLRKAELIALIQEGNPPPAPRTRSPRSTRPQPPPPPRSSMPPPPSIRFRPRQPDLLEERQSNPLTIRQIKRRRNTINKLHKQVKSSERELDDLRSTRDSIMDKIEGARKF